MRAIERGDIFANSFCDYDGSPHFLDLVLLPISRVLYMYSISFVRHVGFWSSFSRESLGQVHPLHCLAHALFSFSLSRGRHFIAVSEFLALKIVIFIRCSAFGILNFKFATH